MGDCGVCIGGYDGEEAMFYREEFIISRKAHTCDECREIIERGVRYERVSGRWGDDFALYRFCVDCSEIGKAFSCGEGRVFGNLWDDIHEAMFHHFNEACLEKLTTASAKHKLVSRWRDWKFSQKKRA